MDSSTILITILAIFIIHFLLKKQSNPFKAHGLPFKKPFPLLGSTWPAVLCLKPYAKTVQEIYNMEPEARYIGFYNRTTPTVMLRDPELIKSIAIKHFDHFHDHRGFGNDDSDPFFTKNLLLLQGDRWKEIRALLSPAFTSSKLKSMFKLMAECALTLGRFLETIPERQDVIEMKDIFTRYTNDVFASCAFGISVNSLVDRDNKFYVLGREALSIHSIAVLKFLVLRLFPRLSKRLGITLIGKGTMAFFKDTVSSNIRNREENGIVRPDFIQLMMESKGKLGDDKDLTIEDIAAHAFSFFLGGFETTSGLMCFAAHELAVNVDVQLKLREEIDRVLKDLNGSTDDVTYEVVTGMRYLDAVINETLRLYPIIPVTDRQCSKSFQLPAALPELKPYAMNEASHLWIPIYGIQRDPKYFQQPDRFVPDRFLNKRSDIYSSGVYLPFGIGPRVCVASRFAILQAKVALFHVLASCELKACSKTTVPMELKNGGVFLTAKNGFWLKVRSRDTRFT